MVANLTVKQAKNALATVVPGLEAHMAKGQMEIRHYTEFHQARWNLEVRRHAAGSGENGSTVTDKGFVGLRASGSTSWMDNEGSRDQFILSRPARCLAASKRPRS